MTGDARSAPSHNPGKLPSWSTARNRRPVSLQQAAGRPACTRSASLCLPWPGAREGSDLAPRRAQHRVYGLVAWGARRLHCGVPLREGLARPSEASGVGWQVGAEGRSEPLRFPCERLPVLQRSAFCPSRPASRAGDDLGKESRNEQDRSAQEVRQPIPAQVCQGKQMYLRASAFCPSRSRARRACRSHRRNLSRLQRRPLERRLPLFAEKMLANDRVTVA